MTGRRCGSHRRSPPSLAHHHVVHYRHSAARAGCTRPRDRHALVASIREKTGLSQPKFAELLGVSVRTLQEWEQGRRANGSTNASQLAIGCKDFPRGFQSPPPSDTSSPGTHGDAARVRAHGPSQPPSGFWRGLRSIVATIRITRDHDVLITRHAFSGAFCVSAESCVLRTRDQSLC